MQSVRVVNEEGLKALRRLAGSRPNLFIEPVGTALSEAMITEAGTDNVWGEVLELHNDLDRLKHETESGHGTDAVHAASMRAALPGLTPATASNESIWASINCFAISSYVSTRWSTSRNKTTKPSSFVLDHWLEYSGSPGRKWNAAARLWWMAELAERIAPFSSHTSEQLLEVMGSNINFYHQTIDRTYLAANPKLLAVLYDVFLDGNEHLNITKAASDLLKSLNIRAGANALDLMDYDELRAVVEEAKPPKG